MCLAPATYQDLPKGEDWCHLALSNHQASSSLRGILYKIPDWDLNFILSRISIEAFPLFYYLEPPNSMQAMLFLISSLPKMLGAMFLDTTSNTSGFSASLPKRWIKFILNLQLMFFLAGASGRRLEAQSLIFWLWTFKTYGIFPLPQVWTCWRPFLVLNYQSEIE